MSEMSEKESVTPPASSVLRALLEQIRALLNEWARRAWNERAEAGLEIGADTYAICVNELKPLVDALAALLREAEATKQVIQIHRDMTCPDCRTPLVWTAEWQGSDCVNCIRRDREFEEQRADKAESALREAEADVQRRQQELLTLWQQRDDLEQRLREAEADSEKLKGFVERAFLEGFLAGGCMSGTLSGRECWLESQTRSALAGRRPASAPEKSE